MADSAAHIRVLLVDDHNVVRRGIARIIQDQEDMEVVGEASDGMEAVEAAKRLHPDVVLMDIGLPTVSGIEATRMVSAVMPGARVLILTVYDREDLLFRALQAGAAGYILKGAETDDLLKAIRIVHGGEVFVYPQMATKLVRDYVRHADTGHPDERAQELTPREWEVLRLLADDLTNQRIGDTLGISPFTVQTHRQRIMQKLNLHSRTQLLRYAMRRGLIPLGP